MVVQILSGAQCVEVYECHVLEEIEFAEYECDVLEERRSAVTEVNLTLSRLEVKPTSS